MSDRNVIDFTRAAQLRDLGRELEHSAQRPKLHTEAQAAGLLGMKAREVQRLRELGLGPDFEMDDGLAFYCQRDVLAWMRALPRSPDGVPHLPRTDARVIPFAREGRH